MRIAVLFVICLLAGCAPTTLQELKSTGVSNRFAVSEPSQVVYNRIVDRARECEKVGLLMSSNTFNGQFLPNLGVGEITAGNNNIGAGSAILHVKVSRKSASESEVEVEVVAPYKQVPRLVESWAKGSSDRCP